MRSDMDSSRNEVSAAGWLDELVEQAWRELGGEMSREHIREMAVEAAARYRDAKVTAYIPMLVRRSVRARLRSDANGVP